MTLPFNLVRATRHLVDVEWMIWWMPTLDPKYLPAAGYEIARSMGYNVDPRRYVS